MHTGSRSRAGSPPLADFLHVEEARTFDATADASEAAVLVLRGRECLVDAATGVPLLLAPRALPPGEAIFAGLDEARRALFAYALERGESREDAVRALRLEPDRALFVDPMFELGRLERPARALLLTALGLARWSDEHRFCSTCAAALTWDATGKTKSCTNPGQTHRHFARVDPATIMLVHDGERVLLGRQQAWPRGMYSTLAGFVEPGESAEEAVAREVFEEAGIEVDGVRYFGSESWPFPRSLMLGYFARARTFDVVVGEEMEDARWFSRAELAALAGEMAARRPHLDTIARRLMGAWLDGGAV